MQRIYIAIFVSLCKVSFKKKQIILERICIGLNIQDQKDLSSYYCKLKKVPLGPKRVKPSNHHDGIHDYGLKEKEEYKFYDITKQVEKVNNNENENEKTKKN